MTITDTATISADPVTRGLARFLTKRLTGLELIDGAFLDTTATQDDDGYIAVEVTRINFQGDDTTMRVLLHITAPMTSGYTDDIAPEPPTNGVGVMDEPADDAT